MNRDDAKFGSVFAGFWGFFAVGFKSEMSLMSGIWPNPSALSRPSRLCWHNIFFLSDLFILFSLSAPHANISARWDHHKMGSSHCNFMLLSHTGKKWSPQWLRNMKVGEEKSLSFSSCLFSMEKLVPLNDHFLAISHSEKLLLRFSSRNLHFYTVWGYST